MPFRDSSDLLSVFNLNSRLVFGCRFLWPEFRRARSRVLSPHGCLPLSIVGRAALVVEPQYRPARSPKLDHDEADAREQLPKVNSTLATTRPARACRDKE
jgi:hypothetical protein